MGVASRTKWERRAKMPTHVRARFYQDKLALRIYVTNMRNVAQREGLFGPRRMRQLQAAAKAVSKRVGHIARRKKAAMLCGWRPYAQR